MEGEFNKNCGYRFGYNDLETVISDVSNLGSHIWLENEKGKK